MMQKNNKDILFYIETETQFDSLMPLLVYLRDSTKIDFDIVVPRALPKGAALLEDVYNGGAAALKSRGFNVTRSVDGAILPDRIINTKYQLLLSAYIYPWHYQSLSVKYRIMFPYASYYFNKPHWTVEQFMNRDYLADALLSHAIGTKEVTDIFTTTHLVPSLKLMDFSKRQKNRAKPVLFFAPTYDEIGFAINFLQDIEAIKKEYTVIMRDHHRVSHVKSNKDIFEELHRKVDKVYDVDSYPIVTPLEEASIVVSDNSAVIFDAIYCGVPVALFSQDPNAFHYRGINTAQSELVKSGDILWTDDPKKILNIVNETITPKMLKKQKEMRHKLFPNSTTSPVARWMDVLSVYLENKLPDNYSLAKRYWIEKINHQAAEDQMASARIEGLKALIKDYEDKVYSEAHPGVRTATKRLVKACLYKLHILERGRNAKH